MKNLILTFLMFPVVLLSGQNFLANPDFEDFNVCEEYEARCAPEAWFRIPPANLDVGTKAFRKPQSGKVSELVVVENIMHPLTYRVFLYTKILCPLVEGHQYQLSFYLNPLRSKTYRIEILFSEEELISGVKNPLNFEPSLILTPEQEKEIDKKSNWRKIETTFTATGKEIFLTLGNFSKEIMVVPEKEWSNHYSDIVYLIDNIALTPLSENEYYCDDVFQNKEKLYAQNFRHRNKISVDSIIEELEKPPKPMDEFLEKPNPDATPITQQELKKEIDHLPFKYTEDETTITFEIPYVAFEFDRTEIRPEFRTMLDTFANYVHLFNPKKIEFIGHTDSMGSEDYNRDLSIRRARTVHDYLNLFPKIKLIPVRIIGMGESSPKADNKTLAGRQENRRVEIKLFKK